MTAVGKNSEAGAPDRNGFIELVRMRCRVSRDENMENWLEEVL